MLLMAFVYHPCNRVFIMKPLNQVFLACLFAAYVLPAFALGYEVEPNNTTMAAMPISLGQPVRGNIGLVSDHDVFKVVASTAGSIRVIFRRPASNYAYNIAEIRVFDSNSVQIGGASVYAPNEVTSFDFGVSAGKSYFIDLSGCTTGSDCGYHRSDAYELLALNLAMPIYETESNDSLPTANPITGNTRIYSQHASVADVDLFKVSLPGAGQFFAQVTRLSDNYMYSLGNLAILDAAGTTLSSDDIYAPEGYGQVVMSVTGPKVLYLKLTSCTTGSRCTVHYGDQVELVTAFDSVAKLSIANVSITEGNAGTKNAIFSVRLSQPTTTPVTFSIATVTGTAVAGSDFTAFSLTSQQIPAGQISKDFPVAIRGDTTFEASEVFYVKVSGVVGATVTNSTAAGTILNDD